MFVLNKLKSIWPILAKFQILSQESKNKILFIIPKLFEKKKRFYAKPERCANFLQSSFS